jgi:glutamine synthetase adenylyltransferase
MNTATKFMQQRRLQNIKVFLGGTIDAEWRQQFITMLSSNVSYFNPIVDNWTEADKLNEEYAKLTCNVHLYYITSNMSGVYSIAEAIDSANRNNIITIFQVNPEGFDESQINSFKATCDLIRKQNAYAILNKDLAYAANIINNLAK